MANQTKSNLFWQDSFQMPHSEELERCVLGTIIFGGKNIFENVRDVISSSAFYKDSHAIIFKEIEKMANNNEDINNLSVAEHLRLAGLLDAIGGTSYIFQIVNSQSSVTQLENNARILKTYETKRGLINLGLQVASSATSPESETDSVIGQLEKSLTEITTSKQTEAVSIDEALSSFYEFLLEQQQGSAFNHYFSTGFTKLDEVLNGGFHKSNLIVFGGRPGNFKTSLSIAFAKSALKQKKKVLFINIEMSTNDIVSLLVADKVNANHLQKGVLTPEELNQVEWNMSKLQGSGLSISSSCNTYNGIVSLARNMKRKEGLDFLIIDYLGLIDAGINKERRQLEIAYMTRGFKALSKELDIPILLLSQLKRPMPGEELHKPRLENLRESGDIEQDADVVIFTHRPDPGTADEYGRLWFQRGMFVVAKNRRGARDVDIPYAHDPYCKQFVDDGEDDPAWKCGDHLAYAAFAEKFLGKNFKSSTERL